MTQVLLTITMIGTIEETAFLLVFSPSLIHTMFNQFMALNQLSYVLYQVDEGAGWVDVSRIQGTLNNDNKVETLLYQENDNGWNDIAQMSFTYGQHGKVSDFILSAAMEDNPTLQEVLKWENTYNDNQLVTLEEISISSAMLTAKNMVNTETTWSKVLIQENQYTDFNKISVETMKASLLGMGEPVDFSKTSYTYDGSQMLVSTIYATAESGGFLPFAKISETTWVNSDKDTVIYTGQGLVENLISYTWNETAWLESTNIYFEWNTQWQNTRMVYQTWENNAWVNENQTISTYENGLIIKDLYQEYENAAFVDVYQDLYNYSGSTLANIISQEISNNEWVNSERMIFIFGSPTPVEKTDYVTRDFSLNNYPNPFNPETMIVYELPFDSEVNVAIYDIQGRLIQTLVQNQLKSAGQHAITWDGRDMQGNAVASGVYFYQLQSDKLNQTKRCLLMK